MRKLNGILRTAVPSEEVLRAARAQVLMRDWDAIVGETLGRKSWPDRYGKGVVWVAVDGSAWATELRMRKGEILDRLRDRAGDPSMFKDIRFGVRPLRRPVPPPAEAASSPDESPATLSIREIAERRLARWRETDKATDRNPFEE